MRPRREASAALAESVLPALKFRSRSTGRSSLPRRARSSVMMTAPSSGKPMPRSQRPKAISGFSGSIRSGARCRPRPDVLGADRRRHFNARRNVEAV